jgi:hypothetical protein
MARPPTESELDAVAQNIAWVRDRWARIPNIRTCAFDGGVEDVRALAYVEYEGLDEFFRGEAQGGYTRFAVVFGNVLVRQTGFSWVVDEDEQDDRLLLRHERMPGVLDPVRLVRRESERAGWRCPKFDGLYERITDALSRGADASQI